MLIVCDHLFCQDDPNVSDELVGQEVAETAEEPETDDDETIATFVTSSGQQLALYAVEDSDEIFAVAVYDESGAPPTNFHFLLKLVLFKLFFQFTLQFVIGVKFKSQ